jgi:ubiquinone/menaquinone biosynthesis C-methylase UbiE
MTIDQAAALLRTPRIEWKQPQVWCDLGSGEGLFTLTLATLLAPGSTIYAVDRNQSALQRIPKEHHGASIRSIHADLNSDRLQLPSADGILMANVLHFIPKQENLLERLRDLSARFLVVEYEQGRSSTWRPYPVSFQKLRELFSVVGIRSVTQISSRKSRFGGTMYSALGEAESGAHGTDRSRQLVRSAIGENEDLES